MINKLYYLLLLFVFYACNNKSKSNSKIQFQGDLETIKIESPGQDSIVHLSNFVKSVKVVPLEFTENGVIGEVQKMKIYKDRIYIQDKYHSSLLVFDIQGKFLYTIGTLGKGKDEYLDLTSFDVNEKGVLIYNYNPSEIYFYDYDGNYLRKDKKIEFQGENFAVQDDYYYLYRSSPKTGSKYELNVYSFDYKGQVGYFPSNVAFESASVTGLFSGASSDGLVPFHLSLNDTIYMLNKDEIRASYLVDFGKYRVSEEDRLELYKNMIYVDKASVDKDFAFNVNNVHHIEDYLFFNYYYRYILHPVFYNKKSKTVINSYNIFDDVSNMIFANPITQYENKLVGVYYPENISTNVEFIQRLIKQKGRVTDQGLENLKLLENLSKDVFSVNAFIILYTL